MSKKKGFEEEAIEEEIWQAVMNACAGEEHLLETVMRELDVLSEIEDEAKRKELNELIAKHLNEMHALRQMRKMMVNKIIELRGAKVKEAGDKIRTTTGELWCLSKHFLLIKIHCFETAQKYMTLGDMEGAIFFVQIADRIHKMFLDTIDYLFPRKEKS